MRACHAEGREGRSTQPQSNAGSTPWMVGMKPLNRTHKSISRPLPTHVTGHLFPFIILGLPCLFLSRVIFLYFSARSSDRLCCCPSLFLSTSASMSVGLPPLPMPLVSIRCGMEKHVKNRQPLPHPRPTITCARLSIPMHPFIVLLHTLILLNLPLPSLHTPTLPSPTPTRTPTRRRMKKGRRRNSRPPPPPPRPPPTRRRTKTRRRIRRPPWRATTWRARP